MAESSSPGKLACDFQHAPLCEERRLGELASVSLEEDRCWVVPPGGGSP